jgi:hypothetical protein
VPGVIVVADGPRVAITTPTTTAVATTVAPVIHTFFEK